MSGNVIKLRNKKGETVNNEKRDHNEHHESEGDEGELLTMLMRGVRLIVSAGLQQRAQSKIKVRQPLAEVRINFYELEKLKNEKKELFDELISVFRKELNVKAVVFDSSVEEGTAVINIEITPELKLEGEAREIIRVIQEGRKKAKFNVEDRIVLGYTGKEKVFEKFGDLIAKEVLATSVENKDISDAEYNETMKIEGEEFIFALKRVK